MRKVRRTREHQELLDRWLRCPADVIQKVGKKWIIEAGSFSHPSIFTTRQEAYSVASRAVNYILEETEA